MKRENEEKAEKIISEYNLRDLNYPKDKGGWTSIDTSISAHWKFVKEYYSEQERGINMAIKRML